MRILYLLSQRPDSTGSGVYLQAMLAGARAAGYAAEALVGVNHPAEAAGCRYFVEFGRDLPYPVVGMSDLMPYPSTRWQALPDPGEYSRVFGALLDRALHEFQPDLIHSNHLWILTGLAAASPVPVVASCHGSCLRQLSLNPHLKPDLTGVRELVALSEPQALNIRQAYGRESAVISPGYDASCYYWGEGPREGVLYAGKLSRAKGVGELLRAWDGPLELVGGGSGEEADQIRELAGPRSLGPLSPAGLAERMRSARVFCLPSFFEGLPLVVIEAVACGCRVVVNELPGLRSWLLPEWLTSGRVRTVELPELIGPDTPAPSALPAYRQRLRNELEAAMAEPLPGPPERVEEYSWERVFERIGELYGRALTPA